MSIIDVMTGDGAMPLHVALPVRTPRGAVVVIMEAFGVNDHIRDVCRRIADAGYLAVAPDLYHRIGHLVTGPYDNPGSVMEHFATLTTDGIADDIGDAIGYVTAQHEIPSERIGVVGFCLGGYGAVLAAVRYTPSVVAGFYGAGLSIPREGSPLAPLAPRFDEIGCPVLLFYGENDPVIPAEEIEATRTALERSGIDAQVHVYPNAGHGFFCDQRAAYVPEAAQHAWQQVTAALDSAI